MSSNLTIRHKRSNIAGNAPNTAQIQIGELAINFPDEKLYTRSGTGIIEIGSKWSKENNSTISRNGKIKVGQNSEPKVAVDVFGTIGQNVSSGGNINASAGQVWDIDSSGGVTVSINGITPDSTTLVLKISGNGTVTWPGTIKWPGGAAPSLTSNGLDVVTLITFDSGTNWIGNSYVLDAQ